MLRKQLDQMQSEEMGDATSDRLTEVLADLEKIRAERDQLLQQVKDTMEQNQQQMER